MMISVYLVSVWILSVQNILCNSNMVRHLLSWPLYGTSKCLITTFVPAIDSQPFPHESPRRQLGTEPIRLQASCLTVELSPQIWWLDQLDPRLWLLIWLSSQLLMVQFFHDIPLGSHLVRCICHCQGLQELRAESSLRASFLGQRPSSSLAD